MMVPAPVVIVSAFGRGLWLAESLLNRSIPVVWVDLTFKLGALDLKDSTGPFPLFETEALTDEQKAVWSKDAEVDSVRMGFEEDLGLIFLTKKGPLELKSEFFSQRMQGLGLSALNASYFDSGNLAQQKSKIKTELEQMILSENWISQWAHRFVSLQDISPALGLKEGQPLPIAHKLKLRNVKSIQQRLSAFKQEKKQSGLLTVWSDVEVEDIAFKDRKTPSGILIRKETSELVLGSNLVWALGSSETKFISERLSQRIFGGGSKEFNKIWMRWQIDIRHLDLPNYFVVLDDPELPWEHSNFLIFIKDKSSSHDQSFSCWMLLPAAQRFNRGYLEKETDELLNFLKARFTAGEVVVRQQPLEATATSREMGPALFGLFREGDYQRSVTPAWNHFFQLASESQLQQGPNGDFAREAEISQKIASWWEKELEVIAKREARNKKRD